ncbi:MAG: hypothetical protein P1P64_01845 [Treponemataceae bacterium]
MKIRLRVLVSLIIALSFVAFFVSMSHLCKTSKAKLCPFNITKELKKESSSFVEKISSWADKKSIMLNNIMARCDFVNDDADEPLQDFSSSTLKNVYRNYPERLDGLLCFTILNHPLIIHYSTFKDKFEFSSFSETFYLVSKKTSLGNESILAVANFYALPFGKKILLIFFLLISFSFLIFLFNLMPSKKYFTEKVLTREVKDKTLNIFKECFVYKNNFKCYDILLNKQKDKKYIKHQLKNIFDFNIKLINSKMNLHTEKTNNYPVLKKIIPELEPLENDTENINITNAMKTQDMAIKHLDKNCEQFFDPKTVESYFEKPSTLSLTLKNKKNKKHKIKKKSFLKKAEYILHNAQAKNKEYTEAEFLDYYENYIPQMFLSGQSVPAALSTKADKQHLNKSIKKENIRSANSIMETDDGLFEIVNTYANIEKNSKFENLVEKILHKD